MIQNQATEQYITASHGHGATADSVLNWAAFCLIRNWAQYTAEIQTPALLAHFTPDAPQPAAEKM
jgi:hypothetical protein